MISRYNNGNTKADSERQDGFNDCDQYSLGRDSQSKGTYSHDGADADYESSDKSTTSSTTFPDKSDYNVNQDQVGTEAIVDSQFNDEEPSGNHSERSFPASIDPAKPRTKTIASNTHSSSGLHYPHHPAAGIVNVSSRPMSVDFFLDSSIKNEIAQDVSVELTAASFSEIGQTSHQFQHKEEPSILVITPEKDIKEEQDWPKTTSNKNRDVGYCDSSSAIEQLTCSGSPVAVNCDGNRVQGSAFGDYQPSVPSNNLVVSLDRISGVFSHVSVLGGLRNALGIDRIPPVPQGGSTRLPAPGSLTSKDESVSGILPIAAFSTMNTFRPEEIIQELGSRSGTIEKLLADQDKSCNMHGHHIITWSAPPKTLTFLAHLTGLPSEDKTYTPKPEEWLVNRSFSSEDLPKGLLQSTIADEHHSNSNLPDDKDLGSSISGPKLFISENDDLSSFHSFTLELETAADDEDENRALTDVIFEEGMPQTTSQQLDTEIASLPVSSGATAMISTPTLFASTTELEEPLVKSLSSSTTGREQGEVSIERDPPTLSHANLEDETSSRTSKELDTELGLLGGTSIYTYATNTVSTPSLVAARGDVEIPLIRPVSRNCGSPINTVVDDDMVSNILPFDIHTGSLRLSRSNTITSSLPTPNLLASAKEAKNPFIAYTSTEKAMFIVNNNEPLILAVPVWDYENSQTISKPLELDTGSSAGPISTATTITARRLVAARGVSEKPWVQQKEENDIMLAAGSDSTIGYRSYAAYEAQNYNVPSPDSSAFVAESFVLGTDVSTDEPLADYAAANPPIGGRDNQPLSSHVDNSADSKQNDACGRLEAAGAHSVTPPYTFFPKPPVGTHHGTPSENSNSVLLHVDSAQNIPGSQSRHGIDCDNPHFDVEAYSMRVRVPGVWELDRSAHAVLDEPLASSVEEQVPTILDAADNAVNGSSRDARGLRDSPTTPSEDPTNFLNEGLVQNGLETSNQKSKARNTLLLASLDAEPSPSSNKRWSGELCNSLDQRRLGFTEITPRQPDHPDGFQQTALPSVEQLENKWNQCADMWSKLAFAKATKEKHVASEMSWSLESSPNEDLPHQHPLNCVDHLEPELCIETADSPTPPREWKSSFSTPGRSEGLTSPSQIKIESSPHRVQSAMRSSERRDIPPILFNDPLLLTTERARNRKHRDSPSTPHRILSSRPLRTPSSNSRLTGLSPSRSAERFHAQTRKHRDLPCAPHRVLSSRPRYTPSSSIAGDGLLPPPTVERLRGKHRRTRDLLSTPHRVLSSRPQHSPASNSPGRSFLLQPPQSGSFVRNKEFGSKDPFHLMQESNRSKTLSSIERLSRRRLRDGQQFHICTRSFNLNKHTTMGPCHRCWSLATAEEQSKFLARGSHLCIVRTRGGCGDADETCKVFPLKTDDEDVRLCRNCFCATHAGTNDRLQVYKGNHNHVRVIPAS